MIVAHRFVFDDFDLGAQIRLGLNRFDNFEPGDALHDQPNRVGHFDQRSNDDRAAVAINPLKARFIFLRSLLCDHTNDPAFSGNAFIDKLDSCLSRDAQRSDEHRVNHAVTERQDVDLTRNIRAALLRLFSRLVRVGRFGGGLSHLQFLFRERSDFFFDRQFYVRHLFAFNL